MINRSYLVLSLLFLIISTSNTSSATDGTITFTGRIVEPTCSVQFDNTTAPKLARCATTSATVSSQIVTPQSHMLVWRANETTQKDLPVNQWKVIQVTYQ